MTNFFRFVISFVKNWRFCLGILHYTHIYTYIACTRGSSWSDHSLGYSCIHPERLKQKRWIGPMRSAPVTDLHQTPREGLCLYRYSNSCLLLILVECPEMWGWPRAHTLSHTQGEKQGQLQSITNDLMVLYSLTAGHKGIITQDVWHSIWRLYTRLYFPSQNGTNTYCMQT